MNPKAASPTSADWDSLQATLAGELLLPGSPRYAAARRPAIARFHDVLPEAVVLCASPADVAETSALARRSERRQAGASAGAARRAR